MDIMQAIIDIEKKARGIVDSIDEMKKQNSAAVEAAVEGSVDKMKMALLAHPLVREYELVEKLVPELLEANKAYLPQFNL